MITEKKLNKILTLMTNSKLKLVESNPKKNKKVREYKVVVCKEFYRPAEVDFLKEEKKRSIGN